MCETREKSAEEDMGSACCAGGIGEPCRIPEPPSARNLCCGAAPERSDLADERPGYKVCSFVEGFVDTEGGRVPRIKTRMEVRDIAGGIGSRLGGYRDHYRVTPGLYCTGRPGPDSPVLVSANYKLSFDNLRRELHGLDVWVLVIDTRGINVWCAAGKKTFSTEAVVLSVQRSGLERIVKQRKLILPQLSATGVSAARVRKESGFQVIWGPVKARDVRQFMESGMKASPRMRTVTFSLWDRTVLVPVEVSHAIKPAIWGLLGIFLLSGIGPSIFSFGSAWSRGIPLALGLAASILAGAVIAPILLPWMPGKAFSVKGALAGSVAGLAVIVAFWGRVGGLGGLALFLFITTLSSYLTMNFTGSTPFTSPSGVEKEMRKAIPFQTAAVLVALAAWVGSAFVG